MRATGARGSGDRFRGGYAMRKVADCRSMPSEAGCSLTISGEPEEVLRAATEHAVSAHGHRDDAALRDGIVGMLADEAPGSAALRAGYAAFARGDLGEVLGLLDPSITWTSPPTVRFGGTYEGHDGVTTYFSHLPENFAELSVEPDAFLEQGDTVLVLGHARGSTVTGTAVDLAFCHVWTMRDGRATSVRELFDTAELNAALGLPAQRGASVSVDA